MSTKRTGPGSGKSLGRRFRRLHRSSILDAFELELAGCGEEGGVGGTKFPMPGFIGDGADEAVRWSISFQPLVDLVGSVKQVMTCVQIEGLTVLVV